jgi:hypothetical protein
VTTHHIASTSPTGRVNIVIEFDRPQTISGLVYEVEETTRERRQEVRVEASGDGGQSYRQILVQEYNFSPGGATYQREEQRFTTKPAIGSMRLGSLFLTLPTRMLAGQQIISSEGQGASSALSCGTSTGCDQEAG